MNVSPGGDAVGGHQIFAQMPCGHAWFEAFRLNLRVLGSSPQMDGIDVKFATIVSRLNSNVEEVKKFEDRSFFHETSPGGMNGEERRSAMVFPTDST